MKNKNGFTLVEILAVIGILALLMIIAIPTYTRILSTSKDSIQNINTKELIDGGNLYGNDLMLGDAEYSDSTGTYKGYSFKEHMNDSSKLVDNKLIATIPVTVEYLVKNGYYNDGCDYDDAEKKDNCKVNRDCIIDISFEVEKIKALPNCDENDKANFPKGCTIYYDLKNVDSKIENPNKCLVKR